jgi:hypothetical protein
MRTRCYDSNYKKFYNYGGRGITICDQWLVSFEAFLADVGERPPGCTLERRENDGNYDPGNCYWATKAEQSRNKRNNRWITFRGERKVLVDWAASRGMSPQVLRYRINRGWSPERALLTPIGLSSRQPTSKPLPHHRARYLDKALSA